METKNERGHRVILDWVLRDGLSEVTFELSPEGVAFGKTIPGVANSASAKALR